ncbi:MAG: hydroxyisourate hydrolase [Pseudomonadota bacterium]|jgi:5-hydroxyisourate hydrolase
MMAGGSGMTERRLTTHVLDLTHGVPAAGLSLSVHRIGADGVRSHLADAVTNADGRCDGPLLTGDAFAPGEYEILFRVEAYFATRNVPGQGAGHRGDAADAAEGVAGPAFLGDVPIRFRAAAGRQHYHVPLLVSPYGYSTYRGS